jgi:hypothetical protein
MKKTFKLSLFLVLLLALALPGVALAKDPVQDRIVIGENYTLASGEKLDGNLVVFGGNVTLESESTVTGDVVLFGGNLDAAGTVEGSVISIGGTVLLQASSFTGKDVAIVGGSLKREPGAEVEGDVASEIRAPFTYAFPSGEGIPGMALTLSPVFRLLRYTLSVFLWAGLAVLVVLFVPAYTGRVSQAVATQPLLSGGLGLLTLIVLPPLLLILLITILLAPVALVGAALAGLAWAFGLVAIGLELGKRLAESLRQTWAPAVSAGIGTFFLILVVNGARELVPCVGWLLPVLTGLVGLGAVLLTRFGMYPYPTPEPLTAPVTPLAPLPPRPSEPPAPPASGPDPLSQA